MEMMIKSVISYQYHARYGIAEPGAAGLFAVKRATSDRFPRL
jgi:hypothetical protein